MTFTDYLLVVLCLLVATNAILSITRKDETSRIERLETGMHIVLNKLSNLETSDDFRAIEVDEIKQRVGRVWQYILGDRSDGDWWKPEGYNPNEEV